MRKIIVAALAASLSMCGQPSYAATPGEIVDVIGVCKDRATVERHVSIIASDKSYTRAGKDFAEEVKKGACFVLPEPLPSVIEVVGLSSGEFMDTDGDVVEVIALHVRKVWTIAVKLKSPAKKT